MEGVVREWEEIRVELVQEWDDIRVEGGKEWEEIRVELVQEWDDIRVEGGKGMGGNKSRIGTGMGRYKSGRW